MILVWASPFNNHLVSMVSNDIRSCMDKVYVELGMEVWQERQSQQKGYASPITWLLVRCILRFCSQLKKTPSLDPSVAGPIETPWPCLLLIMILTTPSRQRLADYPPPPLAEAGWLSESRSWSLSLSGLHGFTVDPRAKWRPEIYIICKWIRYCIVLYWYHIISYRILLHIIFLYDTLPHHFIEYQSVLHCTALHCTALRCAALHCTALHCTALHCTALHCTALHCTALHCTVLYCTVLYCTVLYCTVLYCTVLCCAVLCCAVLCCAVLCCAVLCCAVLCNSYLRVNENYIINKNTLLNRPTSSWSSKCADFNK